MADLWIRSPSAKGCIERRAIRQCACEVLKHFELLAATEARQRSEATADEANAKGDAMFTTDELKESFGRTGLPMRDPWRDETLAPIAGMCTVTFAAAMCTAASTCDASGTTSLTHLASDSSGGA